jgi:hypothetical protein
MPATVNRRDFLKSLACLWSGLGVVAGGALIEFRQAVTGRGAMPAPRRLKPPKDSVKRHV